MVVAEAAAAAAAASAWAQVASFAERSEFLLDWKGGFEQLRRVDLEE